MTIATFTLAPLPADEAARLTVIRAYGLDGPDLPSDPELEALVGEAAERFAVPIVLVSIVTEDRQRFRACLGVELSGTPRSISFCGHAILEPGPFIVADATADPRFAGNPLVLGPPFVRFYAGVPLISPEGAAIGTLCLLDTAARRFDTDQVAQLVALGAMVMARLDRLRVA